MKWRRGLLFAGIHFVISAGMITWNEAPYWHLFRSANPAAKPTLRLAGWQEEGTISFNPCAPGGAFDHESSPMDTILFADNLPVSLLNIGHTPCSGVSSLDAVVESRIGPRTKRSEAVIGILWCLIIAVEWLLVGGLPLLNPKRLWLEPGTFITICSCVATAPLLIVGPLTLLRVTDSVEVYHLVGVCRIPMGAAVGMWFWWFGLLIWTGLRFGWRVIRRKPVARVA